MSLELKNVLSLIIPVALILAMIFSSGIIISVTDNSFNFSLDATSDKVYSLTQETTKIIDLLNKEIAIFTLYSPGNEDWDVLETTRKYHFASDLITAKNFDPLSAASFISVFNNPKERSIIVTNADYSKYIVISPDEIYEYNNYQRISKIEMKLTHAINYVGLGKSVNIKFNVGHRENEPTNISAFSEILSDTGYKVSNINLGSDIENLQPETDILFDVSPRADLTEIEMQKILAFLKSGGIFVLLLDKAVYFENDGRLLILYGRLRNYDTIIESYGMDISDKILQGADLSGTNIRLTSLIMNPAYEFESFRDKRAVISESSPIMLEDTSVIPLLYTANACTAVPIVDFDKPSNDFSEDTYLTAAASNGENGTFILFSSSSFIGNNEIEILQNKSVIIDAINLLRPERKISAIAPKAFSQDQSFPLSNNRSIFLIITFLIVIPSSILIIGIFVAAKRKNRRNKKSKKDV